MKNLLLTIGVTDWRPLVHRPEPGTLSFSRDSIHNNDRGKQIIGRVLLAHFRAAT